MSAKLRLEQLEDRTTPAIIVSLVDGDGYDNLGGVVAINDAGQVAFSARPNPGTESYNYLADGETVEQFPNGVVAINNLGEFATIPSGTGVTNPAFRGSGRSINDSGVVVFAGQLAGEWGIFTSDGITTQTVHTSGASPDFLELWITNNGDVLWVGTDNNLHIWDGISESTFDFGGLQPTSLSLVISVAANGMVGFYGEGGIYTWDGSNINAVATSADGFSSFFIGPETDVAVNDLGQVAFTATRNNGTRGIFLDGELVIAIGEPLFGSTVARFNSATGSGTWLNNSGQIGLAVELADNRQFIILAELDEFQPSSPESLASEPSSPINAFIITALLESEAESATAVSEGTTYTLAGTPEDRFVSITLGMATGPLTVAARSSGSGGISMEGVIDPGQEAILEVQLPDGTWSVVGTATADSQGKYQFSNMPAGTYRVRVRTPMMILPRQEDELDVAFGEWRPGDGVSAGSVASLIGGTMAARELRRKNGRRG